MQNPYRITWQRYLRGSNHSVSMDTEMKSEKDISIYSQETKVENRVFSWNLNAV